MRKARKALYWFGLVLGVTLFAWQLIGVFRSLLTNTLPVRSIGSLVASWAALVILVYMQMMNWRLILSGSGHRLNMRGLVRGYTLSFLPRYIPGSVWGYISRGEWMHQTYQVPFNVINFSSILDVLVTIVSSVMMTGFFTGFLALQQSRASAFYFLLALLLPLLIWLLVDRMIHLQPGGRLAKIRSAYPTQNIPLRIWLGCILNFLAQWLVLGIAILLINGGFYPNLEGLRFFTPWNLSISTYAFSLAWLTGFVILFVPGGIGVRELVLTVLLSTYLPVSFAQAAVISILSRGLYSLAEIFWIVVGFAMQKAP